MQKNLKTIGKELKNMGYNINSNIKIFSAGQLILKKIIEIIEIIETTISSKIEFGTLENSLFTNLYRKYLQ